MDIHYFTDKTFKPGVLTERLQHAIDLNVTAALTEDAIDADHSAQLIAPDKLGRATIISRQAAVLAGCFWGDAVFNKINEDVRIVWHHHDGAHISTGQHICTLEGPLQAILNGERTTLNFLQTLSATATATARLVEKLAGAAILLDTRKTIPGIRIAQKYAVACGGGNNHRCDLSELILIKDNHIKAGDSINRIATLARERFPNIPIEVEVETLAEVKEACSSQPDIIMLDNFLVKDIIQAVKIVNKQCLIEVSGGVTQQNIVEIARYGVDFISIGDITKNIDAIDLSLQID